MEYNYPPYRTELPQYPQEPPRPIRRRPHRPPNHAINAILFIITVFSTLLAGSFLEGGNPFVFGEDWLLGIPFSITLLAIIGFHELGHYVMCRVHGVEATLPYFIPAPTIIGTLGAVIKIRSPITSAKALFDIGAAGPITGFVVTLPALYIGISGSEVREAAAMAQNISFGDPLIMKIAIRLILGEIPNGFTVYISSIGFAGWVGLLVTAFNLLPLGQLDGGHIAYSLMGRRQAWLGYGAFFALFPLAILWWGWFIWIILAMVIKIKHPVGMAPPEPLDRKRKILGFACLVMFVLCFIPVPIHGMGLVEFISSFMY